MFCDELEKTESRTFEGSPHMKPRKQYKAVTSLTAGPWLILCQDPQGVVNGYRLTSKRGYYGVLIDTS